MELMSNNTGPISGSMELTQVLSEMNNEGGFGLSILTDAQGLTIASASANAADSEQRSAIIAIIQRTISQMSKRIGMAQTDEITFHDTNGLRIVCRQFSANSHNLILAVQIFGKNKSYRRLTNNAMIKICHIWSQYWEQINGFAR